VSETLNRPTTKQIGLIAGPLAFTLILLFFHPEGLSPEGVAILAGTAWVAIWWTTEAIPIAATSLLPVILFPLTGGLALSETTASYGHKYIFLYIGGFIIAIAIERWNLHRRIALSIIHLIGTNIRMMILGFMVATAVLSMWISNTATTVMMLPIGMAIIAQLQDNPDTIENENRRFGKALMLAIAYSASIGGIATLIGTPPNLVLAQVVSETFQIEITFASWMKFGLPISILLLFICWWYLTRIVFKFGQANFPGGRQEVARLLKKQGPMSYEEKWVFGIFLLTALAWISRSFLLQKWLPAIDDPIIAVMGAILLFLIPAREKSKRLIDWQSAVQLPWGILLLFGGGLALAQGFKASGLALWIGSQLSLLEGTALILLLLILVTAVNFLTEITSNLATTAMILPILAPIALTMGVHPYVLMIGATVAASCAFMLPVATPPNAIVFGPGYLTISDMMRAGFRMNLLSILLVTLLTYFLLPLVWNFDRFSIPAEFLKIQ
jgi:sodium-dependent dicarboxylate transporter 2/3/5